MNRLYENKENGRRKLFLRTKKGYCSLDNYEIMRYFKNIPEEGSHLSNKDFRILAFAFKLLNI